MMEDIKKFIAPLESWVLFDNNLLQYLSFVGVTVGLWLSLELLRRLTKKRLLHYCARTRTKIDDHFVNVLASIKAWFLFFIAVHFGSRFLSLHPHAAKIQTTIFVIATTIQVVIIASYLLVQIVHNIGRGQPDNSLALESTKHNIIAIGRIVIFVIALLFLLDNLGVNISTFITGLGIGGIAIALAAQAILGDAFSAFTIGLDKPFEVGDFIVIDSLKGTVERVGLKTTRIRSLNGELLVFANSDLTKSRIQNFKRMEERRVNFTIGVTYDTPLTKLKMVPDLVKGSVEGATEKVRFDRTHLREFGDSALLFDVVYWVHSREMPDFVEAQQEINFKILEKFAENSIEIAFPTRVVYQKNLEPDPAKI